MQFVLQLTRFQCTLQKVEHWTGRAEVSTITPYTGIQLCSQIFIVHVDSGVNLNGCNQVTQ